VDARIVDHGAGGACIRSRARLDDRTEMRKQLQEDTSGHMARRLEEIYRGTIIYPVHTPNGLFILCITEHYATTLVL